MKVIEATDFYLRVIKFDFVHKDPSTNLRFRIVPMFHIGSEQYYQDVFDQLNLDLLEQHKTENESGRGINEWRD